MKRTYTYKITDKIMLMPNEPNSDEVIPIDTFRSATEGYNDYLNLEDPQLTFNTTHEYEQGE